MQASTPAVSKAQATLEMNPHSIESVTPAHKAFLKVFYRAAWAKHKEDLPVIELPEAVCGNTGYYEKLVKHNFRLPVGSMVRAVTPGENNRRMIIIVGQTGNLVIFERYTAGANGVLVRNIPNEYIPFVGGSALSEDDINRVTGGNFAENIVENMMYLFNAATTVDFSGDRITNSVDKDDDIE